MNKTNSPRMKVPTIHINGTSRKAIEKALANATSAIRVAERALEQTAPNARDYYHQGPEAFGIAAYEHQQRAERLASVRAELEWIYGAIDDENPPR